MPQRRPSNIASLGEGWRQYDQRLLAKLIRIMAPLLAQKGGKRLNKRQKPTNVQVRKPRVQAGYLNPNAKVDWTNPQFHRLLGSDKDEIIAKRLGVSDRTVRTQRARAGIPPFRAKRWTPRVIAMLGKIPDDILAQRFGIHPTAVKYQRQKRDIPPLDIKPRRVRLKKNRR
jgi:hypothetical protein